MEETRKLNRSCGHIMATGVTCGSYALRDSNVCYWHHKAREARQRRGEQIRSKGKKPSGLVLPLLEDANSIQLSVQMIAQAVADRRINRAEAGSLLYSIQLAIMNLKNVRRPDHIYSLRMLCLPGRADEVEDVTRAEEIPVEDDPAFEDELEEENEAEANQEEIAHCENVILKNKDKLIKLGILQPDVV